MRRMMVSVFVVLVALFATKSAQAQTTSGGNAPSALTACIAELNATQEQLRVCQAHRTPDGNLCMVTLGAQMIDGRCQCPPVYRHGRLRDQVPVSTRLANGNLALACGTPHESGSGVATDRVWVIYTIHHLMDPIIAEILRRLHEHDVLLNNHGVRITEVERRQAELLGMLNAQNARIDTLREALRTLCAPLDVQAQPSAAPPANTDAALVTRCRDFRAEIERMSQAITALIARVAAQGDELDQLAAQVRDHEARIAALEGLIEGRISRRLFLGSLYLGLGGSFPLGGNDPIVFGRVGFRLAVSIARSDFSFQVQGEGGGGSGVLGGMLAFGGRLGVAYRPENSVVGFALGATGRNFWAPWAPPPGIQLSGRGWSAGGFAAVQLHLGKWLNIEPWIEVGAGRSIGRTPQGTLRDSIDPVITPGIDLVINLNP